MSDQYPPGPQQPGYQPEQQPGYQPQQGTPSAPYGNAQPYGQPTPQSYGQPTPPPVGQQPGQSYGQQAPGYGQQAPQPYGQPAPGYDQNPYMYNQQQGARPRAATGASVVGIVDGGLGILAAILLFLGLTALQSIGETPRGNSIGLALTLGYIQSIATIITAVALLVSGITFLQGKNYKVLLYAAFAQVAIAMLAIEYYSLITSAVSTSSNGTWIIDIVISLGLAGSIIYLLFTPAAKSWRKS